MMSRPHVALFWLQVVSIALNIIATWMLILRVYSDRDLSDWYRPPFRFLTDLVVVTPFCLAKTSLASFYVTTSKFKSRHGFVMLSVSLGRDLSDWSRPLLGSLNNKMVAT